MLDALQLTALKSDERFRSRGQRNGNLAAFYREVDAVLLTKTTSEWITILHAHDVPAAPLNTLESLLRDPHLGAVDLLSTQMHPSEGEILSIRPPATWSATPPSPPGPAPQLGQDTRDVLSAAGFSESEIDNLVATKAIGSVLSASHGGPGARPEASDATHCMPPLSDRTSRLRQLLSAT